MSKVAIRRARVCVSRAASTPAYSTASVTTETADSTGSRSIASGRPVTEAMNTLVSSTPGKVVAQAGVGLRGREPPHQIRSREPSPPLDCNGHHPRYLLAVHRDHDVFPRLHSLEHACCVITQVSGGNFGHATTVA